MLTAEAIAREEPGPWGAHVAVAEVTGSTNHDLMAAARAGAGHGQVLFAEEQTRGRGRLGRHWHSPRGVNLYFSVLLYPPRLDITQFPPFALVAGLAVAEAIHEATGLSAKVKWPNDVLIGRRKVAGLLTEALPGSPAGLVVGVGLNVNQDRFPPDLREIATSLALATGQVFRVGRCAADGRAGLQLGLYLRSVRAPDAFGGHGAFPRSAVGC